jgi:prefoldin subunit 5
LAIERLKKQVDELTGRNKELIDEVKHLESLRI